VSRIIDISIRGKQHKATVIEACDVTLAVKGRWLKIVEIFDEYWLERDTLPAPAHVIAELKQIDARPDIFCFAQRVPETAPTASYYHEMDNFAVLPLTSYDNWFQNQIPASTRRNIRASKKRSIAVRVCDFNDDYVRGISSIYNESPIRAGRRFWHYGKDLDDVRRENGTYAERSTYLAAYCQSEMIGYLKIVWDKQTAAIMQILSKLAFRDNRPNNALMAEAVRQACLRGVEYLLYEKFDYGKKTGDSLTKFKQNNGFIRMDVPRYYVPLTEKGAAAIKMGLHKDLKERVPEWLAAPLRSVRQQWYERRLLTRQTRG
jgi:hypothetical protein